MAIIPVQSTLEYTGERFIPGKGGAQIHYEHFHRYGFVRNMVRGKKVLDIGSSEGYGASLLAQEASFVLASDVNHNVVCYAKRKYPKDNLHFILADAAHMPIPDNTFDIAVVFEMIEHTCDQDLVLREIKRILKNNGILIISSPNKEIYSEYNGKINPYHVKELYREELEALLGKYFSVIRLFGQRTAVGSAILEESRDANDSRRFEFSEVSLVLQTLGKDSIPMKDPVYFIAVCTNDVLVNEREACSFSFLYDPSCQFVNESIEHAIKEKENQLREKDELLRLKDNIIIHKDNLIQQRDEWLHQKDEEVRRKDKQVDEKNRKAEYLAEVLSLRDARIRSQDKEIQILHNFAMKVKSTIVYRIYKKLKGIL